MEVENEVENSYFYAFIISHAILIQPFYLIECIYLTIHQSNEIATKDPRFG